MAVKGLFDPSLSKYGLDDKDLHRTGLMAEDELRDPISAPPSNIIVKLASNKTSLVASSGLVG